MPATTHSTFVLARTYPVTPDRLFAALSDPAKKRRWFGESENHDVEQFDMDFQVGGKERSVYRFKRHTQFPGVAIVTTPSTSISFPTAASSPPPT